MQAIRFGRISARGPLRTASALVLATTVAACDVGPLYEEPQIDLPARFSMAGKGSDVDAASLAWWRGFNDAQLDDLVARGLSQNLDIQQALERIRQARAVARGTGANVNVTGDLSVERQGNSDGDSVRRSEAQVGASWLIDLFGLNRSRKRSALAQLDAAFADADTARIVFLSELANAYVDMRFFEARIALAQRDLASRRETLNQVRTVFDAGEATQLELTQAEALLSTTQAEIPVFQASLRQQQNRIATLLGVPAGGLALSPSAAQPVPTRPGRIGVPADLIRNRPDIRSAERLYASAVADVGTSKAELYPSIRLNGNIGIVDIDSDSSRIWEIGPAISIPIFNQGTLQANVEASESVARQRYLNWRSAVLSAVEEVESALFGLDRLSRSVSASRQLVESNRRGLEFSRTLAQNGEITLLQVIEAERQISEARETLAQNLRDFARNYVALNVALGSGYAAGRSS